MVRETATNAVVVVVVAAAATKSRNCIKIVLNAVAIVTYLY